MWVKPEQWQSYTKDFHKIKKFKEHQGILCLLLTYEKIPELQLRVNIKSFKLFLPQILYYAQGTMESHTSPV